MTTQSALETALASYLRSLAGANKSSSTIVAYRTDLQQFLDFLQETNITVAEPRDVTRVDIAEYLNTLADQGRSGITRARKLAAIREFFRFLQDQSLIEKNPTQGIETPKKERTGRNTLRPDEYTKLLSLAGSNPRDYAILQVFLQTGLRVSELCALTLDDIDLANRTLRVAHGKGSRSRTITLEKKGIQALKTYLAVRPETGHEQLFLNYTGAPLSERGVRKMLDKYLAAAGITKKISPHSLRHTFATSKAEQGVSAYLLKEWLGHERLDTTQIYVHMSQTSSKRAMEATSL